MFRSVEGFKLLICVMLWVNVDGWLIETLDHGALQKMGV